MIPSSVRNVFGKIQLPTLLSADRVSIMKQIQDEVILLAKPLGIEIVDVRIIRTELPVENRNAVFDRMNSELIRYAKENRAKGDEIARGIRAKADRERAVLLAEANQKSQGIRGKGDAKAIEITNNAFGVDPEFYTFYRNLEIYRETFDHNTSIVLSTDNPIFSYFSNPKKPAS
jgi:membrane protease subunit HflC